MRIYKNKPLLFLFLKSYFDLVKKLFKLGTKIKKYKMVKVKPSR